MTIQLYPQHVPFQLNDPVNEIELEAIPSDGKKNEATLPELWNKFSDHFSLAEKDKVLEHLNALLQSELCSEQTKESVIWAPNEGEGILFNQRQTAFRALKALSVKEGLTARCTIDSLGILHATFYICDSLVLSQDIQLKQATFPRDKESDPIGFDLRGINLSGVDMSGIDLTGADLEGAILDDANLEKAILIKVKFDFASMKHTNLYLAILTGASLVGTDLSNANMAKSLLIYVNMEYAILIETNLYGCDICYSTLDYANFSDSILRNANICSSNGYSINFSKADMKNILITYCMISESNLSCTNMYEATINLCVLNKVNLSFSSLKFSKIVNNDLSDADLSHTDLTMSTLCDNLRTNTNLDQAELTDIEMNDHPPFWYEYMQWCDRLHGCRSVAVQTESI